MASNQDAEKSVYYSGLSRGIVEGDAQSGSQVVVRSVGGEVRTLPLHGFGDFPVTVGDVVGIACDPHLGWIVIPAVSSTILLQPDSVPDDVINGNVSFGSTSAKVRSPKIREKLNAGRTSAKRVLVLLTHNAESATDSVLGVGER